MKAGYAEPRLFSYHDETIERSSKSSLPPWLSVQPADTHTKILENAKRPYIMLILHEPMLPVGCGPPYGPPRYLRQPSRKQTLFPSSPSPIKKRSHRPSCPAPITMRLSSPVQPITPCAGRPPGTPVMIDRADGDMLFPGASSPMVKCAEVKEYVSEKTRGSIGILPRIPHL